MKIAITGPAASGKGTIARGFASEAKIGYVDLGLIFRLGAFGLSSGKIASLEELPDLIKNGVVVYAWTEGKATVLWQGEDVTVQLLSQDIAYQTSVLASDPEQQEMLTRVANLVLGMFGDVVCDGRNAGITILPDADYKFFVTARLEERARRRHADILRRGEETTYEDILREVEERDKRDAERIANPLIVPDKAVVLETDNQTVEESIRFLWETITKP
jgi:cytidylate kinase